jgi:hypothetical protein
VAFNSIDNESLERHLLLFVPIRDFVDLTPLSSFLLYLTLLCMRPGLVVLRLVFLDLSFVMLVRDAFTILLM